MCPLPRVLLLLLVATPALAQPAPPGANIQPGPPGAGIQPGPPSANSQPAPIPPALPPNMAHVALVTHEAERRGIPPALGHAVTTVESGWNPAAIGADGEVGLMQVMPATAAMLGFHGTPAELADPATNVRLGVQYLGDAWFLARGDLCAALMKYRAGHGEDIMSPRSVEYCARVRAYLAAVGSPLASTLPVVAGGTRRARTPRGPRGFVDGTRFWAAWTRKVEGPRARRSGRQVVGR